MGKMSYNEEESIAYGKNGELRTGFIKSSLRLNAATLDAFTSEVSSRERYAILLIVDFRHAQPLSPPS